MRRRRVEHFSREELTADRDSKMELERDANPRIIAPMLKPATDTKPQATFHARSDLRVFRLDTPYAALGLAVSYLMTKPAFAALRFGEWSRILVGQINRKHYYFVVDARNQVQGFLGWAVTSKDKAEAWLEGRGGQSDDDSFDGPSIIFNVWAASNGKVNRFLLQEAR